MLRKFQFTCAYGLGTATLDLETGHITVDLDGLTADSLVGHPNEFLTARKASMGSFMLRTMPQMGERSTEPGYFTGIEVSCDAGDGRLSFAVQYVTPVGTNIEGFEFRWGLFYSTGGTLQVVGFRGRIDVPAGGLQAVTALDVKFEPLNAVDGGFFRAFEA